MTTKTFTTRQLAILVEVIRRSDIKLSTPQWDEVATVVGEKTGRSAAETYRQTIAHLKETNAANGDDDANAGAMPKIPDTSRAKVVATSTGKKRAAQAKNSRKPKKAKIDGGDDSGDEDVLPREEEYYEAGNEDIEDI